MVVIGLTGRQWSGLVKATETAEELSELEAHTGQTLRDEGTRWALWYDVRAMVHAAQYYRDWADVR